MSKTIRCILMKLITLPGFTIFHMATIIVLTFILSSITVSIVKYNILSDLYNKKLARFVSVNSIVQKCDVIVDTWTAKSKRSSSIVNIPVFKPLYHVEYTYNGKKYTNEIITSKEQSYKSFREVHKNLCMVIGSETINLKSYDNHEWLDEDILYIVKKEYESSFPETPSFTLGLQINPEKPAQISLGDQNHIHIMEAVLMAIVTAIFFSLIWLAPNYSNANKFILSTSILCIALLTGLHLNTLLNKLPKKSVIYSFTIGSAIEIEPLKSYISEGLKEELKL